MNAQEIIQQLQTLDAQNPGAWPRWARIAAVIFAAVVLFAAGVWFMIKPVYEQVQTARAQEQTLFQELDNKQKKVAAIDAYREQLKEMERQFGDMLKQLPSRAEVANLLNDISQKRVEASLEEELFQPTGEVPKEFYAAIPNKIVVVGDYHEMGNFVSAVAALPRIVTIEDVEIKGAATGVRGAPVVGPTTLRMTATAQTYRYLDDEEIEAAKPQKPAGRRR
ncbi:MAG: type 4a pilus biogenesis protein PilO [Sinimarinibacterium flocculans]|uniref:type 4a pilus biogenesis protein PilO n=1 Tax=Sinimarinibacterium flocculans TaxID=985250 RepID=UPI003C57B8AA